MVIIGTKVVVENVMLELTPIGAFAFGFNRKNECIWENVKIEIVEGSEVKIKVELLDKIVDLMIKNESNLLTDGELFYTLFGGKIIQVKHKSFDTLLTA